MFKKTTFKYHVFHNSNEMKVQILKINQSSGKKASKIYS